MPRSTSNQSGRLLFLGLAPSSPRHDPALESSAIHLPARAASSPLTTCPPPQALPLTPASSPSRQFPSLLAARSRPCPYPRQSALSSRPSSSRRSQSPTESAPPRDTSAAAKRAN